MAKDTMVRSAQPNPELGPTTQPSDDELVTRIKAGDAVAFELWAATKIVEIHMRSRDNGAYVTFDPIGVLVQPGTKIRWVVEADVHTTTAYHPLNDSHSLRIPTTAQPWASDYLVNPGDSFEVTLTLEGVYDYYCTTA
jgi:plastocyanin